MEIVITAIIGYVAYAMFKGRVLSKSRIATEIQRLFNTITHLWIGEFQGDARAAARAYVEQYWDKIESFRKGKARVTILAASILAHAAKDLHDKNDENTDFVLQSFGRALGEIHSSDRQLNPVETMVVQKLFERFQWLVMVRDAADAALNKDLAVLTGQAANSSQG